MLRWMKRLKLGGWVLWALLIVGVPVTLAQSYGWVRVNGNPLAGSANVFGWVGRSVLSSPADGVITLFNQAKSDFSRLQFGGTTSSYPAIKRVNTNLQVRTADDSAWSALAANDLYADVAAITQGSGTGITVNSAGSLRRQVYKVTVTKDAFITAGPTADATIATLPAKTVVLGVYADTTVAYAGLAGTITLMVGVGATPNTYIVAHDVKTAAVTKGLADADLGTSLANASSIQGGKLESFTGTTPVLARITSGTGNVGNGAATLMSAGSTTYYIVTERLP